MNAEQGKLICAVRSLIEYQASLGNTEILVKRLQSRLHGTPPDHNRAADSSDLIDMVLGAFPRISRQTASIVVGTITRDSDQRLKNS